MSRLEDGKRSESDWVLTFSLYFLRIKANYFLTLTMRHPSRVRVCAKA